MLLRGIFVDTSAWIALYCKKDSLHEKAKDIYRRLLPDFCLITTNFILDETYTGLLYKAGHTVAVDFGERIRNTEAIKIIYITETIEDRSWKMFKQYSDKKFSFTDCTSFIIVQDLLSTGDKVQRMIFTADNHFNQMGYEILL
ncbi:MAG: PIN domain-containing protein [Candidatus Eremiobacterota bacterium]